MKFAVNLIKEKKGIFSKKQNFWRGAGVVKRKGEITMANQENKKSWSIVRECQGCWKRQLQKRFFFPLLCGFSFSSPPKEEEIKAKVTEDEEKPPLPKRGGNDLHEKKGNSMYVPFHEGAVLLTQWEGGNKINNNHCLQSRRPNNSSQLGC